MSFVVLLAEHGVDAFAYTWRGVVTEWRDTLLVGVPALLYLIQNNLLYVATTHLDAATCQATAASSRIRRVASAARLCSRTLPQVAYQLKLLTTAFFTVTMLRRHISLRRCPVRLPARHAVPRPSR